MILPSPLSLLDGDPLPDSSTYRSIVGALQYVIITRPDISFAVKRVCQFMHNPTTVHWMPSKRFKDTIKALLISVQISPTSLSTLTAYSDANWPGDLDEIRSTGGVCVFFGSSLLSWFVKKQTTVSRSSTESEYRPLAFADVELSWIRQLLQICTSPCYSL